MERHAASADGFAGDAEDFVVAQDADFEEPYEPADDDERELDDGAQDDDTGVDEDRRVDLSEEPAAE